MVSEISLLVHPLLIGEKCYPVFAYLKNTSNLKLKKTEHFGNGCIWMVYTIEPGKQK